MPLAERLVFRAPAGLNALNVSVELIGVKREQLKPNPDNKVYT